MVLRRRASRARALLKKGFFPHEFNLPHHQNYVGSIPGIEFFDPDGMSEKKKKELEEWHADQVRGGLEYDFAREMEEYCKSDVALLQAGCEAFTKEFVSHADANFPFVNGRCHLKRSMPFLRTVVAI